MRIITLILIVIAFTGCGLYKPSVDMENLSVTKMTLNEEGEIVYQIADHEGNGFKYTTVKDKLQVGEYVRLEKYKHKD